MRPKRSDLVLRKMGTLQWMSQVEQGPTRILGAPGIRNVKHSFKNTTITMTCNLELTESNPAKASDNGGKAASSEKLRVISDMRQAGFERTTSVL